MTSAMRPDGCSGIAGTKCGVDFAALSFVKSLIVTFLNLTSPGVAMITQVFRISALVTVLVMALEGCSPTLSNFSWGDTVEKVISLNMLMIEEAASLQNLS